MHHRDAKLARRQWVGWTNHFALEVNLPGVGGANAGEDFAERAFARAVLADERVAPAAIDFKAHAIEREHAGKTLGDLIEREKGHVRFHGRNTRK